MTGRKKWFQGMRKKISINYGGNNVSMTLSNVKDTKNIEDFLVENIKEIIYSYEDEKPLKYSEDGKMKYL